MVAWDQDPQGGKKGKKRGSIGKMWLRLRLPGEGERVAEAPQQTTFRLALLAYFFFCPRQFFSPLPPDAEPGPRLSEW